MKEIYTKKPPDMEGRVLEQRAPLIPFRSSLPSLKKEPKTTNSLVIPNNNSLSGIEHWG